MVYTIHTIYGENIMPPIDFNNRPNLPLTETSATEYGVRAASNIAIRTLIELLDDPNRKRKFQDVLVCAKKCVRGTLNEEFTILFGERHANKMTNPDVSAYWQLNNAFVDRLCKIQDTYHDVWP